MNQRHRRHRGRRLFGPALLIVGGGLGVLIAGAPWDTPSEPVSLVTTTTSTTVAPATGTPAETAESPGSTTTTPVATEDGGAESTVTSTSTTTTAPPGTGTESPPG